jgi:hypothetical protein
MAKAHDRVLEIVCTMDESDDTIAVTALKYYRDRAKLAAAEAYSVKYTPATALATGGEITLGEVMPPPTHIRFTTTFQA